jgi:hypothetical protein
MFLRLKAFSGREHDPGQEILVNITHVVSVDRHDYKPCTVLRLKGGTLYVHETLDQIAEKVGGCP